MSQTFFECHQHFLNCPVENHPAGADFTKNPFAKGDYLRRELKIKVVRATLKAVRHGGHL